MSSMVDLKKFFESDKTNFDHLEPPKDKAGFMEDLIENNEDKKNRFSSLYFSENFLISIKIN